jgi:hypothetical protein
VIPRSTETSSALYRDGRIAVTPRAPAHRLARRPRRVDRAHRGRGSSLPLPALPSDEPLPDPLFGPLRGPFDPRVVPRLRAVLLPLPVPVSLPLPVSLADVGVVVSGGLPMSLPLPLPVLVPLSVGAPDPEGVCGEPVRSGSFVCGSGGSPGTVAPGDVALLLYELLVLDELFGELVLPGSAVAVMLLEAGSAVAGVAVCWSW